MSLLQKNQGHFQILHDLTLRLAGKESAGEVCQAACEVFARDSAEFPSSLIYLAENEGQMATLVASCGIPNGATPARTINLIKDKTVLLNVFNSGKGEWCASGQEFTFPAFVLPLSFFVGRRRPVGFLVVATATRSAPDLHQQKFLKLVAYSLCAAISQVQGELERSLFETVLQQMPAAVIVGEAPSGRLILSNPQVKEVWRHPLIKSQNVDGYGEWIGYHPDGRRYEGSDWPLARALQKGEIIQSEDTDVLRGDGTRGIIRLSAAPIRDGSQKIIAAVVTCEDVTDKKRAEEERARLLGEQKAAIQASHLKSQFLANMSHEIRTPLNGVIGMADLLMATGLNTEQAKYARVIEQSGNLLLTVINDILDFSKIEAGKIDLEAIDFDPVALVESQADLVATKAYEKGLSLLTFVDPELPAALRGDPGRLGQILLNLISNAVKFTAEGTIVVRALKESDSDGTVRVRFSVEDTGIGISPSAIARLFQPFTQADASTVRHYGGTGLGLSICKRLVELMGGNIGVDSAEGRGSTFWFTAALPRSTEATLSAQLAQGISESARAKLKVLVVDDNYPSGEILFAYARNWGMRPVLVKSGAEALKCLRLAFSSAEPFDIAIIDKQMEGMDGFQLGGQIKADPDLKNTHLILVTAFDKQHNSERAARAGFSAYLTKPIKQSELLDAISNCVHAGNVISLSKRRADSVFVPAPADEKSGRILVVEDNSVNRLLILTQLEHLGYSAQAVANGVEALEAVALASYDLILMDCQMPEMDGFAATRELRRRESETGAFTPIVALTANAMKEDEQACLASGMDGHIGKPIKTKQLAEALNYWLTKERKAA